jgi:hypothetical protein
VHVTQTSAQVKRWRSESLTGQRGECSSAMRCVSCRMDSSKTMVCEDSVLHDVSSVSLKWSLAQTIPRALLSSATKTTSLARHKSTGTFPSDPASDFKYALHGITCNHLDS